MMPWFSPGKSPWDLSRASRLCPISSLMSTAFHRTADLKLRPKSIRFLSEFLSCPCLTARKSSCAFSPKLPKHILWRSLVSGESILIGSTFANGLRSLLRQDPNIIMVGEIRDNETAGLAINAALTGHLVLSTLHTNSSAGALPRLLDMHVEPFLIASTVNAIIAQRLVRTLCEDKEMRPMTEAELATISKQVNLEKILEALKRERIVDAKARIETIPWGRPKPGEHCPDGYRGRIGIHEVLQMTLTIQELIMKNATASQIEEQARKEGMLTMLEDGFVKAAQGITSLEEVLRVTSE